MTAEWGQGPAKPTTLLKSDSARRFLLVSLGVISALLLLEFPALVNALDYRTIIGVAPHDVFTATNLHDPELGHLHPPHSHYSGEIRGGGLTVGYRIPPSDMTLYRWDVKYDHNGFRNELDLKSADMIVIGDSFVEEITIPGAQMMTSLLAHLQGKVVANLGQYGYGPQQELIVLKRYGLPLRPSTVVWMFFEGNDLQDVLNYDQVMRNRPSFWSAFVARSFTKNALKGVKRIFFTPGKSAGVEHSGVIQAANGQKITMYFLPFPGEPLTKDELSAIDETGRVLADAHKLCAAQGSRLIFVFIPDKFRVFHSFCQFPQESECRNWVLSDMPERLERAVRSISLDIGYLDLTPSLLEAVKHGTVPYYPDDDHWSAEGHKVAAEAINNYLLSTRSR